MAERGDLTVTALYTSHVWTWARFAAADLLATKEARDVFRVTNFVLGVARVFRPELPRLKEGLAQRHAIIDRVARDSGTTSFVELAAGLSPRGASFSADPSVRYLEVDLPNVVAKKRELLERTAEGRAVLSRSNFLLHGADVTAVDLESLGRVVAPPPTPPAGAGGGTDSLGRVVVPPPTPPASAGGGTDSLGRVAAPPPRPLATASLGRVAAPPPTPLATASLGRVAAPPPAPSAGAGVEIAPCVIAEGFFMYLAADAQRALWRSLAAFLRSRGTLVFDLVPAVEQPKPGRVGRFLDTLFRRFTKGATFAFDERTRDDLVRELHDAGFTEVTLVEPATAPASWTLPHLEARTQQLVFVCRVAGSIPGGGVDPTDLG